MNWGEIAGELVVAGAGALITLSAAYVVIGHKLSYIEGNLTSILGILKTVEDLKIDHAMLRQSVERVEKDVTEAHEMIRSLQN